MSNDGLVTIEILPLTLPPTEDWHFHLDLWQNPWSVARMHDCKLWSERHMYALRPHLRNLADAGQKVVTTTVVENVWASQTHDDHGSMVKWMSDNDDPTQDLQFDFSTFEQYVELCWECGIRGPIHIFSILPWGSNQGCGALDGASQYVIEHKGTRTHVLAAPGDKVYTNLWSQFLHAFTDFARCKGWTDRVHFAFDERHEVQMQAALKLLNDNLPTDFQPPKTASAYEYNEKYTDVITDLSPLFESLIDWNYITDARRKRGQRTTFYLCEHPKPPHANNFLESPIHENIWVGWYAAANGFDGFLRWAYDSWPEDPLLSGDFPGPHGHWPAGDTFLSYPNGWRSRRLALLRDGIQDYEKLRILTGMGVNVRPLIDPFTMQTFIPAEMVKGAKDQLDDLSRQACGRESKSVDLFILRHGDRYDCDNSDLWAARAVENRGDHRDPPLSRIGKLQAIDAARYFRDKGIKGIYSSPYLRTLQTAECIAEHLALPLNVEEGLSEGYHQKVENVRKRTLYIPQIDEKYQSVVTVKDGEQYPGEFNKRCKHFAEMITKHLQKNSVLVSHAATSLQIAKELVGHEVGSIGPCEVIHLRGTRNDDGVTFRLVEKTSDYLTVQGKTKPWP